jgi:hypothetical protein
MFRILGLARSCAPIKNRPPRPFSLSSNAAKGRSHGPEGPHHSCSVHQLDPRRLKTWELRGSATKVRGPVALIEGGSGTVVGTCEISAVVGPLGVKDLRANATKLNVQPSDFSEPLHYGDKTHAWVLSNVKRLKKSVPYQHPSGAVIWVKLSDDVRRQVGL